MRNKVSGIILSFAVIGFVLFYRGSDGFSSLGGSGGGGASCVNASFVTLNTTSDCASERVLTGTSNQVTVTDNGAGSTVVLSLPQDIDTSADVQFGTGVFDGQSTSTSPAILAQNIADVAHTLAMRLSGPDRTTPAVDDRLMLTFMQEITSGFVDIARIETRLANVGALTESQIRWYVMDNGSLQLSAIFENDDIALTRDGGSYRLRSTDGVTIDISGSAQTSASTVSLTIPDAVDSSDSFVLRDAAQTIIGKTLDGDDNTFVDVKPDQWDNSDSPVNGECPSYQSNQIEWIVCGGASPLGNDLPVVSGASTSTSIYSGVPGVTFTGSAGAFVTTGQIYYQPFQTSEEITINRASFEVTSAGNPSDYCRIALYEDDGNMQPGALVADWGQVVNDSTGWKHATVSTTISAGQYLMALGCNTGPGLRDYNGKSYLSGGISTSTTSSTRFVENMRVTAPTGTPLSSGYADPGQEWNAVDLNTTYNYGYWMVLRWS